MPENAYNPPQTNSTTESANRGNGLIFLASIVSMAGSSLLLLLGCAMIALGFFAADGRDFFVRSGALVLVSGLLGSSCVLFRLNANKLQWMIHGISILMNSLLIAAVGTLLFNGTLRGPMWFIAPVMFCVPAAVNVAYAAVQHKR
ncbi:MAG: hypothetical protein AAGG48_25225 [Planctomycetota bacterium]